VRFLKPPVAGAAGWAPTTALRLPPAAAPALYWTMPHTCGGAGKTSHLQPASMD
jgi:hypothetical protein